MLPDSLQVVDQPRQFHVYNVSTTDNWTDRNSKNNFKHTNHISQITKNTQHDLNVLFCCVTDCYSVYFYFFKSCFRFAYLWETLWALPSSAGPPSVVGRAAVWSTGGLFSSRLKARQQRHHIDTSCGGNWEFLSLSPSECYAQLR